MLDTSNLKDKPCFFIVKNFVVWGFDLRTTLFLSKKEKNAYENTKTKWIRHHLDIIEVQHNTNTILL